MRTSHRNEQGFALATAILALVVVGALVTAGFFAASQEGRVGTSNAQADLAFYVAEQGVQNTLGTVRKRQIRDLTRGQSLTRTGTVAIGGRTVGNYTATLRPFGNEYYFLESVGTVTQGGRYAGATRRLGMVVRTLELNFPMTAALTSYGGIDLDGRPTISGVDTNPGIWSDTLCDPTTLRESGIRTTPGAQIDTSRNVRITGDPRIEYDSTLTPDEFTDFGDVDITELREMATHIFTADARLTPDVSFMADGRTCNRGDRENWGNPRATINDCSTYFPIIYADGNMTLAGNGYGQGILVVEGNLSVAGTFDYYGIVIVGGGFNNQSGSGNANIHGTLLTASNADIDYISEFGGSPVLQFSTCTVTRAIEENDAVARLFPVQKRSWVDLTAAGVQD